MNGLYYLILPTLWRTVNALLLLFVCLFHTYCKAHQIISRNGFSEESYYFIKLIKQKTRYFNGNKPLPDLYIRRIGLRGARSVFEKNDLK